MADITLRPIEVPLSELVTANQREHWAPKARKTKALRWQGRIAASRAASWHGPLPYCRVDVAVGWPDKRRRDVHNVMPTVKALIDGIVDAGLLADDSDQHIQGPDLRPYIHDQKRASQREPIVFFTIQFTPLETQEKAA